MDLIVKARHNLKNFSTTILNGRILYLIHQSRQVSILPPKLLWRSLDIYMMPYGWEPAIDSQGKTYYINHNNKTTTYQLPMVNSVLEERPLPRTFELERDFVFGYGFIVGSECPTVVRCVNRAGPADGKLLPGDQILNVNGLDVYSEKLTDLANTINSNTGPLIITVCQPYSMPNTSLKSSLMNQSKKELIKASPCRVRFAENLTTNYSASSYSTVDLNDECSETEDLDEGSVIDKDDSKDENKIQIKSMPTFERVIKVHLENGQTKSFAYISTTTVQNIIDLLIEKLSIKKRKHFALCLRSIKSNRMQTLQPDELISKIADLPSSHNMKITFRFAFLPPDLDFYQLSVDDKVSFDYLYCQCLEDLKKDSVFAQVNYETALRLLSLHVQQLYLMASHNSPNNSPQKTAKELKSSFLKSSTSFLSSVVRSKIPSSSNLATNNKTPMTNFESTTSNEMESTSQTFDTTADHALKNSKKWIKQIADSYGLESFVPSILTSKFKQGEIISHLNKCFNRNQFQLIPFVAKKFVRNNNGDQQPNKNESNAINRITEATSGQLLLSLVSETTKKSSGDLSKIRINEELVKLCFLVLYTDISWFGAHSFPLRNSLNEFRVNEVLNPFDKALIKRIEHDEANNGKNSHLLKQVGKISAQVWLSPKIGICQIVRTSTIQASPYVLAKLDEIVGIKVTRYEGCYLNIELKLNVKLSNDQKMKNSLFFVMDEPDANEFIYCLQTFFSLQFDDELEIPIDYVVEKPWWSEDSPNYNSKHLVKPALWSYPVELIGVDSLPPDNSRPVNWQTLYGELKEIDLSKPLPTYSDCADENSLTKNTKMYFDSKGNQIDLLNDSHGLNQKQQSKSVQHDSDYSEEEYASSKEEQDDSSELSNDSRFNNVKADEKEIYLHSNNQESLSDSDPISADLLMSGQHLQATDSLLMMRQDENDDTISDTMMITDCFLESDTDSNETNIFGDNYLQSIQLRSSAYDSNSLVIEVNKDNLTELNKMNGSEELILSNPMIVSKADNPELIRYGTTYGVEIIENDSFEESEDSLFTQGTLNLDQSEIHDPTKLVSPLSDNTELMITTSANEDMSFHSTLGYLEYNNQEQLPVQQFDAKENAVVQYLTCRPLSDEEIRKMVPPPPPPLQLENLNRMIKVLNDHLKAIDPSYISPHDLRDLHSSSSADSGFESPNNTFAKYMKTSYEKREYDECYELLRLSREHQAYMKHRDEIVNLFKRQENRKIISMDSIICGDAIKRYRAMLQDYAEELRHIHLNRYYLPLKKDTLTAMVEEIDNVTEMCENLIKSINECSTQNIVCTYAGVVCRIGAVHRFAYRLFHRSRDDNLARNLFENLNDLRTNIENILDASIRFTKEVEKRTLIRVGNTDTSPNGFKLFHYFKRMMADSLSSPDRLSEYTEYADLRKYDARLSIAIEELRIIATGRKRITKQQIELV